MGMATAKTGSFYLTETVSLAAASPDGTRVQGTIDLGAYVNVPTGQAIAIDSVDFVYQVTSDYGGNVSGMLSGNGAITAQLSDLNPNTLFVRADDQSLIASGSLNIDDTNNIASHMSDLFPDNYGGSANLNDSFMVVNDTLYLVVGNDSPGFSVLGEIFVTARIRCKVVKLSSKNWMAIAIQSVASDS